MNDENVSNEMNITEEDLPQTKEFLYVIGISFKKALQVYFFGTIDQSLKLQDPVVVETARGIELGYVKTEIQPIEKIQLKTEIKPVLRKATEEDLQK